MLNHATPKPLLLRVDPRARLVAAVVFSVVVAVCNRPEVLGVALAAGLVAVWLAGLGPGHVARRLLPLNVVMLMLLVMLPLTARGEPIIHVGPVAVAGRGVWLAVSIAVKGNAILLAVMALIGTLELPELGHALAHLRAPDKLVHLLLFTVRYLGLLEREAARLHDAARVRGFRPGCNRHTFRTYGYLVGMLLVNSARRGERIVDAMKCRGFRGRFYLLDHFAFSRIDVPFAVVSSVLMVGLILMEWS
ncbi:MAG: cobalt ECF transporter T component CbiQ [Pirellulales bacterium]|nr:cobalt ECF transporter T component CbiQ [Pirellulales bacterium]